MDYELYHHGILGQKWGIRRYQNADGSLTPAGEKRYQTNKRFRAQVDRQRAKSVIAKNTRELSNEDLQAAINRMNLENNYARLMNERLPTEPPPSKAKQMADKFISKASDRLIDSLSDVVGKRVSKLIGDAIFGAENQGKNNDGSGKKDKKDKKDKKKKGDNNNQNTGNNNNNQNNRSTERLSRRERRRQEEAARRNELYERSRQLDNDNYNRREQTLRRMGDYNLRLRQQNIDAAIRVREQNLRYGNRNVDDVRQSGTTSEGRQRTINALEELSRMNGR